MRAARRPTSASTAIATSITSRSPASSPRAQDTPSCSGNFGGGLVATVKGFGKSVDIALQDASNPGVQLMLELSYPFVTGGTFHLYQTTNGITFSDALDGTYSIDTAPERGEKSGVSATAAIKH